MTTFSLKKETSYYLSFNFLLSILMDTNPSRMYPQLRNLITKIETNMKKNIDNSINILTAA